MLHQLKQPTSSIFLSKADTPAKMAWSTEEIKVFVSIQSRKATSPGLPASALTLGWDGKLHPHPHCITTAGALPMGTAGVPVLKTSVNEKKNNLTPQKMVFSGVQQWSWQEGISNMQTHNSHCSQAKVRLMDLAGRTPPCRNELCQVPLIFSLFLPSPSLSSKQFSRCTSGREY